MVEQLRELNAQEVLLGVPVSAIPAISHTQQFLEPFLRLWESHEVRATVRVYCAVVNRCLCVTVCVIVCVCVGA